MVYRPNPILLVALRAGECQGGNMFVDYLTLLMINLVAGLFLLAVHFVFFAENESRKLAPGFLATGFISTVAGLHLTLTWQLPGANNIPIGEMSVFFGVLFLVAGLSMVFDWDLLGVTIVAGFAGLAAVVLGLRYLSLGMSQHPVLSGLGYIIAGAGAILTIPGYFFRSSRIVRYVAAGVLAVAAAIWAVTGYGAYWSHLESFATYSPAG